MSYHIAHISTSYIYELTHLVPLARGASNLGPSLMTQPIPKSICKHCHVYVLLNHRKTLTSYTCYVWEEISHHTFPWYCFSISLNLHIDFQLYLLLLVWIWAYPSLALVVLVLFSRKMMFVLIRILYVWSHHSLYYKNRLNHNPSFTNL